MGWAFWPPETDIRVAAADLDQGAGIWIPHIEVDEEETDEESEVDEEYKSDEKESEPEDVGEGEDTQEESEDDVKVQGLGRFGALIMNDSDDEDEEEEEV